MKLIRIKYLAVFLFSIGVAVKSQAQDKGYKMNMEMTADEKGDAAINVVIKYNAQNWDIVKSNHGTDASVLKNIWKKQFPKYQLTEFDIKSDDMERSVTSKFKILGMLKVDAKGKWIASLDQKSPDITKISDNQFMLVDESTAQTLKIILPKSASDAKVENDAFGKAVLTYTAPVTGGGLGNAIKYLGFAVIAGGIFLFFKNRGLNTVVVKDNKTKNINYPQTKHIDDAVVIPTSAPIISEPIKRVDNDLEASQE